MTLVDVLAGVAILSTTVMVLAPMSTEARVMNERTALRLRAECTLISMRIPSTPAGEQPVPSPPGCTLRWSSELVPNSIKPTVTHIRHLSIVDDQHGVLAERSLVVMEAPP